jgi:hypothetical protein
MTHTELLSRIPAPDWEATPVSVRNLLLALLPLEAEVSMLRARLHSFKQPEQSGLGASESQEQAERVKRYQQLVDQFFLMGLSEQETQELERLGTEMDADAAPFYEAALQRMAAANNGRE